MATRRRRKSGLPPVLLDDFWLWFSTLGVTALFAAAGALFAAVIDEPGTPGAPEFAIVGVGGGLSVGLVIHRLRRRAWRSASPG